MIRICGERWRFERKRMRTLDRGYLKEAGKRKTE